VSSRLFHYLHRPDIHARPFVKAIGAVAGCALVVLLAAGCGGANAASTAAAAATPKATPGMSAYLTCLRQHGVKIPTTRPTAQPTARPSGGFASPNPAMAAARTACASLRPKNGFGGFGGQFATAFQAFRTCMSAQGEPIPTARPTAPPTPAPSPGTDRFLNGLNPNNPKVAAALKACESKLPKFPTRAPSPAAS
jgi:hypothetical protein